MKKNTLLLILKAKSLRSLKINSAEIYGSLVKHFKQIEAHKELMNEYDRKKKRNTYTVI